MKKTGNNIFRTLRVFFGLFMVIVYLGMAYLMFINFLTGTHLSHGFVMFSLLCLCFMVCIVATAKLQVSTIIATDVMTTKKIN